MTRSAVPVFPFSAIVGQEKLKKALMLNAVDPGIGGILIVGERGTAKSTAVRAFASLLPPRTVIEGCLFGCDPSDVENLCEACSDRKDPAIKNVNTRVVELPVSATEDRVIGSIDITAAVKEGMKEFEPGILADANGNILYVDEVNLLSDHIVDSLLDVAAMGVNTVEREGISHSHPSRFVLVGTMNPEEGDLRPQLIDRFGLSVSVSGAMDIEDRLKIVERRLSFELDPLGYREEWEPEDSETSQRVVAAKKILPSVTVDRKMLEEAVRICLDANVSGHRADITVVRTAKAIAALDGRTSVTSKDIREAASLALPHRMREPPEDQPPPEPPPQQPPEDSEQEESEGEENSESKEPPPEQRESQKDEGGESEPPPQGESEEGEPESDGADQVFEVGETFKVKHGFVSRELRVDEIIRSSSGRRTVTESSDGRYVGYREPKGKPDSIAIDATIRAAAARGRSKDPDRAIEVKISDVKEKVRQRKTGNLLVFVVDASGSMGAERRMSAVKGAIMSLLQDAYQKRDRVALVVFRGSVAQVVVPPTGSTELAARLMETVPTGGRTPIAAGLHTATELILSETSKDRGVKPVMIVVSDGRANVSSDGGEAMEEAGLAADRIREMKIKTIMIDSETGFLALGFAKTLAERLGAKYMVLDDLAADTVRRIAEPAGWSKKE